MFWLTKVTMFFCPDFQFKKKNLKVILFISVLSHSSISGGGKKVGRRKAVFHPGVKHALTSLVVLIYVTAPVAAVSGLPVPLQTSHTIEKQKMCCALSRNDKFLAEYAQYQLGYRQIEMWRFLSGLFFHQFNPLFFLEIKWRSRERQVLLWAPGLSKMHYCGWTHQVKPWGFF